MALGKQKPRQRIAVAARQISARVATVGGRDFPYALVRELARLVPSEAAIVAERGEGGSSWRTVACAIDAGVVPDFECELWTAPQEIRGPAEVIVATIVAPEGHVADGLHVLGVRLANSSDDVVGFLGLLQRDSLPSRNWLPVLETFASRCLADLETRR